MEYGSFYECLGKMLLSTEAEDVKAQAELILELQLGLQNKHVELQKYRGAEDRNRTRKQGYSSKRFRPRSCAYSRAQDDEETHAFTTPTFLAMRGSP